MLKLIASFAAKCWIETAGVANRVDTWRDFKSITLGRGAGWAMTMPRIWWPSVHHVIKKPIISADCGPHTLAKARTSFSLGREFASLRQVYIVFSVIWTWKQRAYYTCSQLYLPWLCNCVI
jgi:hypothetical protein